MLSMGETSDFDFIPAFRILSLDSLSYIFFSSPIYPLIRSHIILLCSGNWFVSKTLQLNLNTPCWCRRHRFVDGTEWYREYTRPSSTMHAHTPFSHRIYLNLIYEMFPNFLFIMEYARGAYVALIEGAHCVYYMATYLVYNSRQFAMAPPSHYIRDTFSGFRIVSLRSLLLPMHSAYLQIWPHSRLFAPVVCCSWVRRLGSPLRITHLFPYYWEYRLYSKDSGVTEHNTEVTVHTDSR